MPGLSAKLKRLLDALALADAGEMLLPREKDRVLNRAGRDATPTPPLPDLTHTCDLAAPRRSVVLGVGQSLPLLTLDYALGACNRLDASLLLLCADAVLATRLLELHRARLDARGVACQIVALRGEPTRAVLEYLQDHTGVLFAITSGHDPVAALTQPAGKIPHRNPPVPIVVVSDPSPARAEPLEYRRFKRGKLRR